MDIILNVIRVIVTLLELTFTITSWSLVNDKRVCTSSKNVYAVIAATNLTSAFLIWI